MDNCGYYLCQHNLLAYYAKRINRDFEMMFGESWGFNYNTSAKSIGEAIEPGYRECRYPNLLHFHGIKCEKISGLDYNYLKKQSIPLDGNPLIISSDTYDCPWCNSYRKHHIEHYFFITERSGENLICFDPYFTDKHINLSVSHFEMWKGTIYCLSAAEFAPKQADYIEDLHQSIEHIQKGTLFKGLNDLKENLSCSERLEEELLAINEYYSVPLFYNLSHIAKNRRCFADYITYIDKKTNKFKGFSVAADFKEISLLYDSLWITIMKQAMSKKFYVQKIRAIVEKIYDEESRIFLLLSKKF